MPRRLLRDGRIVADEWTYSSADGAAQPAAPDGLIVSLAQWLADKPALTLRAERLGLVLLPAHKLESVAADLARFDLIAAEFPGPSDGRGYSQGRLLRERHGFTGELRATGYVRHDQVFFLARCGFNSFEMADADLEDAERALHTFSARYQPTNDTGLEHALNER